jgi:glycosyltransferase involved in cell wall biosynthesis
MPDLYAKGGIQVYSTFFLRSLVSQFPENQYTIVVKNDPRRASETASWPEGVRVVRLGDWPPRIRTAAFSMRLAFEECRHRPSLVICGHLNFTVAARWLKRATGVPYWAIAHGIEAWNIQDEGVRAGVRDADRILSVSHFTASRLRQEQQLDDARISLLPNTFEPGNFFVRPKPQYLLERHGIAPDAKILMTVARLDRGERYKGYDRILQALSEIRHHVPNVHYVLVGKGNDRPRIERLIEQHRIADRVTLAGFIPDEELPAYYNLCDVFAMPSKKEGFGIVYLEALASGKPVLAGNRDGGVDALCGGELGVLVDPDDQAEITRALIEMLRETHPLAILRSPERLRERVIDAYSFERFNARLRSIWTEHFHAGAALAPADAGVAATS